MLSNPLARVFRPRPVTRPARLYERAGCGLCREASRLLAPFERRGELRLERVDIEAEPELFTRYAFTIPVLAIEGRVELAWPFDADDVRRALR